MSKETLNVLWKYKLNIDEFVQDFIFNEYYKTREKQPYDYYKQ